MHRNLQRRNKEEQMSFCDKLTKKNMTINNSDNDNNNNNNNNNFFKSNLLLITKLTIKSYLQLISLKKKKLFRPSTIYIIPFD